MKKKEMFVEKETKKKKIGMENFGIALENPNSQCGRKRNERVAIPNLKNPSFK